MMLEEYIRVLETKRDVKRARVRGTGFEEADVLTAEVDLLTEVIAGLRNVAAKCRERTAGMIEHDAIAIQRDAEKGGAK